MASRRPSMSFQSLSHLDNYTEGELIGQGSFGIIHKVTRKSDGAVFAQKQLNFSKMSTKDKQQLVAEVNILNKLQHPHIVGYVERILDSERGVIYLIMEYCGGGDLSQLIRECERSKRHIPEETIWDYFVQIVQALGHCHAPGEEDEATGAGPSSGARANLRPPSRVGREKVLHRDLKPDNVFLDEPRANIKLGDFGLSKALGSEAFAQTYVGTPYYMSPELFSESQYDAKSDIWALGCVIYEMVALHPPFHLAKTHNDLANQLRSQRIPPLPRKISPELNELIMSMLNFNPARRPSAMDLLSHPMMAYHRKVREMHNSRSLLNHRSAQLLERESVVAGRETQLVERERRCADRESKIDHGRRALEADRDAFRAEKARFEDERRAPSAASTSSSGGGTPAEGMDGVVEGGMPGSTQRSLASRVPRRSFAAVKPLEERPNLNPSGSGVFPRSRDSTFDLQSTPSKATFSGLAPSSIRRANGTPLRMASKSMGNLAATARADRLREEECGGGLEPGRRDLNRASVGGSPSETKTVGRATGIGGVRRPSPTPVTTNPFGPDSAATAAPTATRSERLVPSSSRPTLPHSAQSAPPPLPQSAPSFQTSFDRHQLYPQTPAKYDHVSDENLPSPFIKRTTAISSVDSHAIPPLPTSASSSSLRPSMPRSRSTTTAHASGARDAGGLARMAMGNAAAAGSGVRGEGLSRPALSRVSRASGIGSNDRSMMASRDSLARAEAALGDAHRVLSS